MPKNILGDRFCVSNHVMITKFLKIKIEEVFTVFMGKLSLPVPEVFLGVFFSVLKNLFLLKNVELEIF